MTISLRKKWRFALVCGIAVPSLALASCSSDGDSKDADSSASDSGSISDSGSSGSNDAFDIDLSGAPEGFELTEPGTRLDVGEIAQIFTRNNDGNLQFWKVSVTELKDLPGDAFELQGGNDQVDHFVCINYEMTLLGNADDASFTPTPGSSPATEVDGSPMILTARPDFTPIGKNDLSPNYISNDSSEDCGIPLEEKLPNRVTEVEIGKAYRDADLGFVGRGDGPDAGVSPVGSKLYFDYSMQQLGYEDTIYWEKK